MRDPGVQVGASGSAPPAVGANTGNKKTHAGTRKGSINLDTINVNVKLRHHTSEEYKELSDPQKAAIMQSGKPEGNKKGSQKGKPTKGGLLKNCNNKALVEQVTTKANMQGHRTDPIQDTWNSILTQK
jgi:hypothetical protein